MANRYLRASGNWNGPVWAATSGGAAGSAATPTASDNVYVAANYTVTLTADATCNFLVHTNGTISLDSYKLSVDESLRSTGSTSRTMNLGSGGIELVYGVGAGNNIFELSGSNLTLNAGTSLVTINYRGGFNGPPLFEGYFITGSKTFNDVVINIDTSADENSPFNITGSPTFRSLIIQSKNNAAHTVQFDDFSSIYFDKFVGIGSSPSSRLTVKGQSDDDDDTVIFATRQIGGGSIYGQNLNMRVYYDNVDGPGGEVHTPPYIGSNSIAGGSNWLTQDPPKISTFTDSMTSNPVDNTNWHFTGLVQQITSGIDGGGYLIGPQNASLADSAITTGVFDFTNSEIVIEKPNWNLPPEERYYTNSALGVGLSLADFYLEVFEFVETSGTSLGQYGQVIASAWLGGIDIYEAIFDLPIAGSKYVRIKHGGGVIMYSVLDDNGDWHDMHSIEVSAEQELHLRAARLYIRGTQKIGSINILPEPPVPTSQGSFLSFFLEA